MQEKEKKHRVRPGCLPIRTERPIQVFVDEYKWSTKKDDEETYTQIIFNLTERRFKREELPGSDDSYYGYYGPDFQIFVDEWAKYLGHKYNIKVVMPSDYRSDWTHPSNGRIMQMVMAWYFNDVSFVYKKDLPFYPESYKAWFYTLLKPAFGVGVGNQNTYFYCPVQTIQSAIKEGIKCPFEESYGKYMDFHMTVYEDEKIATVGDSDCHLCKYGSAWPYEQTDKSGTERRNCYHSTLDPKRIVKFHLPLKEQAIASIDYFVSAYGNKIDFEGISDKDPLKAFIENYLLSDKRNIRKLHRVIKTDGKLFCFLEEKATASERNSIADIKKYALEDLELDTLEDIRDCVLKYDLLLANKRKCEFNRYKEDFED